MNQMIAPGREAGPKVVRLLCFVSAGFLCTAAINKWRELERKSTIQKQQAEGQLLEKPSNAVQRALE
nr:Protein split ends like [Ipomoea batatas]GMC76705.1 Protein split ends like [Ipomoea batatas]